MVSERSGVMAAHGIVHKWRRHRAALVTIVLASVCLVPAFGIPPPGLASHLGAPSSVPSAPPGLNPPSPPDPVPVWANGYLTCGTPASIPYGLNLKTPGLTALGDGNFLGLFVNDTNADDWVRYRPWLYEHGHGWMNYGWRPWMTVPPGMGVGPLTEGLGTEPVGVTTYVIVAVEVTWYHGVKSWAYVQATPPASGFGVPVHDSLWCHYA